MNTNAVYETLARSTLAREYKDAFLQATGLSLELVPSDESIRLFQLRRNDNSFCALMAQNMGSCAACQQAHKELQKRIDVNLAPQVVCCFAGLAELAVPVVVGGQHVATLIGGQVFQRKPTQKQFARILRRLRAWGMNSASRRVKTAFFQTRVISRKKFRASVRLLSIFSELLAEQVNRDLLAVRDFDLPYIARAKNFIHAHVSQTLRLRDVSEHVHLSPYYFSKIFKKATGIGFSEFVARDRVEMAKALLANSALLINDVANQAGFHCPSQFNRAFYRYVGCSPKAYRALALQTVPSSTSSPLD